MIKRSEGDCSETKGDGTYVFMRAEDRSLLMRTSYLYDKYRPLIMLALALALAAGFGFKTPKQTFNDIRVGQDSLKTRIFRLEQVALNLDALIRVKCVELADNPQSLQIAGIDCAQWFKDGRPSSPPTQRP